MVEESDVTTAPRPVRRLAVHSATGTLVPPVFPTGDALLETLGRLNSDVRDALTGERARLSHRGYPEDLPLPALWWGASRSGLEPPSLPSAGRGYTASRSNQGHSTL